MSGIVLYQSNRLEWLADCLSHRLRKARRCSFSLRPDIVLVNNYELAQWLSIRMAQGTGVCANVCFRLVGSYIWELASDLEGSDQFYDRSYEAVFSRIHLKWLSYFILLVILKGHITDPRYKRLKEYLQIHGPLGAFELSGQFADLFDRYMNYRPQMLLEWESGANNKDEPWQAPFWRLLSSLSQGRFRLKRIVALIRCLTGSQEVLLEPGQSTAKLELPSRLYIFGLSYLPPLHIEVLKGLSDEISLEIFHLSPSKEYWFHIVSEKKRTKLAQRYDRKTLDELFPAGNRLLASMGLCGRQFLNHLYQMDVATEKKCFRSSRPGTLLSYIQKTIVDLTDPASEPESSNKHMFSFGDDSFQVHVCHSRVREVEVMHDRLVGLFRSNPGLKPHEVAVMAPDISMYAKAIEAVFGTAPRERFIPWSICDVGSTEQSHEVQAFLALFNSLAGGFTGPEIMDLISLPVVMSRFGLDTDALSIIRRWIQDSGICRGLERLSSNSKDYINTWLFGIDRLMASAFFDKSDGPDDLTAAGLDIKSLDYTVEGDSAAILSKLSAFVFELGRLVKLLGPGSRGGFTPERWLDLFRKMIRNFISEDLENANIRHTLMEPIERLCSHLSQCHLETVEYEVMRCALNEEFARRRSPKAFMSGKVLFSSLVPMRAIPFKIICIMGMNQMEFPRQVIRPAFDLMQKDPKSLDPSPSDEDRYLFLETIMSAREKLIISYVGRSQIDDSPLNPSVVVSELIDFVSDSIQMAQRQDVLSEIVVEHPLQPFSYRYLGQADQKRRTYAYEWLPVDEKGHLLEQKHIESFSSRRLPNDAYFRFLCERDDSICDSLQVTPAEIAYFLANPIKGFLRYLHINPSLEQMTLPDHEPFDISDKVDWTVVNYLFSHIFPALATYSPFNIDKLDKLDGDDDFFTGLFKELSYKGLLPHGRIGMLIWEKRITELYKPFLKKLFNAGLPVGTSYTDQFHIVPEGKKVLVKGEVGKIKGDMALIDSAPSINNYNRFIFWIRHLFNCIEVKDKRPGSSESVLLSWKDGKILRIKTMDHKDASLYLLHCLDTYFLSLEGIISFLPNASYEAAKVAQPKDAGKIIKWEDLEGMKRRIVSEAAIRGVFRFQDQDGMKNPWMAYMFRGSSLQLKKHISSEDFLRRALELCAPLLYWMESGR